MAPRISTYPSFWVKVKTTWSSSSLFLGVYVRTRGNLEAQVFGKSSSLILEVYVRTTGNFQAQLFRGSFL